MKRLMSEPSCVVCCSSSRNLDSVGLSVLLLLIDLVSGVMSCICLALALVNGTCRSIGTAYLFFGVLGSPLELSSSSFLTSVGSSSSFADAPGVVHFSIRLSIRSGVCGRVGIRSGSGLGNRGGMIWFGIRLIGALRHPERMGSGLCWEGGRLAMSWARSSPSSCADGVGEGDSLDTGDGHLVEGIESVCVRRELSFVSPEVGGVGSILVRSSRLVS